MLELDGLSLEYKRDNGTARGNLEVSDLVNNPVAGGKCRVLGLSLPKETLDDLLGQRRPLGHERTHAIVLNADFAELLPEELLF